jgi:very-short-patch-repair endonuclease
MKRHALPANAISRARRLRRDMTTQERKLWRGLRDSFPEAHFRKQVPIGIYTADFAWHGAKLIIEVDGGQHGSDAGLVHDEKRTAFLEAEGYRVLRFWNSDVDQNLDGVLAMIAEVIGNAEENIGAQTRAAPTLPSPQGGGSHETSCVGVS